MGRKRAFTELSEKYSLTDIDLTRLKTEFEITQLKVEFAIEKSKTDGISLFESIEKYNAFHRYTEKLTQEKKDSLIKQIESMDSSRFSDLVELLFLNSDRTKGICTHQMDPKCFDYHIWENEGAFIHFFNAIVPRDPFSEREIPHRKNELRDIAIDVRDFHPELKYVFSVSWIWNLRKFQLLMPDSFNDSLKVFKDYEFYTQSYWGQFYRYDGTVNQERVEKFRKDWGFPLEPLIGECSVNDFMKFFEVCE
jgi:hypothetical protein